MEKQRVIRTDGRYVLLYTFNNVKEQAGKECCGNCSASGNAASPAGNTAPNAGK